MNRDALKDMRLDWRLIHRRGWISKAELEKEIEALPDSSHKIAPPEEDELSRLEPAEEATESERGVELEAAPEVVSPRVE
jgi:hypothetical protein